MKNWLSKNLKTIEIVFFSFLIWTAIVVVFVFQQYRYIAKPDPIVSNITADYDVAFFDSKLNISCGVTNAGGKGWIKVDARIEQGGNSYYREEAFLLDYRESKDLKFQYDELSTFGGDYRIYINAYNNE